MKSVLRMIGQGLACQDLGEMSPGDCKLRQIEQQSRNYRLSGGQGRIVLIAGTHALGPAFEFVVELAADTESLIEVLYVDSREAEGNTVRELIDRLEDLSCDFQITFLRGNLLEKMADYNDQRLDIMAVVCSTKEAFAPQLGAGAEALDCTLKLQLPSVILIGGSLLA